MDPEIKRWAIKEFSKEIEIYLRTPTEQPQRVEQCIDPEIERLAIEEFSKEIEIYLKHQ